MIGEPLARRILLAAGGLAGVGIASLVLTVAASDEHSPGPAPTTTTMPAITTTMPAITTTTTAVTTTTEFCRVNLRDCRENDIEPQE